MFVLGLLNSCGSGKGQIRENQVLCSSREGIWGWWSRCQPRGDCDSPAVLVARCQPGTAQHQAPVLLPGAGIRDGHGAGRGSALEILA